MTVSTTVEERFWSHVEVGGPDECWLWTGYCQRGYGRFKSPWSQLAHRYVYMLVNDIMLSPEVQVDHLCHTAECLFGADCPHRRCVNPMHLGPATNRENTLRGHTIVAMHAAKTHCVNGHPFNATNTHIRKRGSRDCRECNRLRTVERRAAGYDWRKVNN